MTRRIKRLSGRIVDLSASCEVEGCDFFADRGVEGTGRVAVSKHARDHTAETGHQTFVRTERMIFYEPKDKL